MQHRTIYITDFDLVRLRKLLATARAQAEGDAPHRPHLDELALALHHPAVPSHGERIPDVATMYSRLRLREGEHTWTMRLVYPDEADPQSGHISVLSPLGAAVLGRGPGERVRFEVAPGEERACGIVSILYQPEKIRGIHCRTVGCR
ncbi:MAG: GreA/GreB family elongation factor [Phycisphaerales bacterium JB064]